MGQSASKAREQKDDAKNDVDKIMTTLENKLEAFELEVQSKRGNEAADENTEVTGGRTVMRVSDIRVSTGTDISANLTAAITSFFDAATNSVDGDDNKAKKSAIVGAKNLVLGGIRSIFGVKAGQGRTKKSFVVLFLNNAFVRVDYMCYSYSASGEQWGAVANESGACYLADLAVLKVADLQPQEIDFLLTQALAIGVDELPSLNRLKFALIESSILGRALTRVDPPLTFDELAEIAEKLAEAANKVNQAFAELQDGDKLLEEIADR